MATASSTNSSPPNEKVDAEEAAQKQHLETIRTVSRVPGNTNYYEKNGLRTYGDDEDHDHEPPVRLPLSFYYHLTGKGEI